MRSNDFLQAAIDVQNQRAAEYDQPGGERSMASTVVAFNAITGRELTEAEGWLFLQILKDVRQWSAKGYHHDSALDGVAYSALKAEALHGEQKTDRPQAPGGNWFEGDVVKYIGDPSGWVAKDAVCTVVRISEGAVVVREPGGCEVNFKPASVLSNFEWVSRP